MAWIPLRVTHTLLWYNGITNQRGTHEVHLLSRVRHRP